ncbi:MAG: hypothetical protein JWO97_4825 [Acidobacteria bacterium]|nr:hypothetical protein [Acidobacteriota bacterium]
MTNLLFRFRDILDELQAIDTLAYRLISRDGRRRLELLRETLEAIRAVPTDTEYNWQIPENEPVVTEKSSGEYEIGRRRGVHEVVGEVTSTWQVKRVPPPGAKRQEAKLFEVSGNASTKITIRDASRGDVLATWRFELGAHDSPGCYVHAQILGESADPPFPASLPVPRLPAILFTPAASLEFVLGELFHNRWQQELLRNAGALGRWKRVQEDRLERLLKWQIDRLSEAGSPWMTLKIAKPDADLFSRER